MKKLEKGFTLIELMIVVAIIAILAAVAAPRFGEQLAKAKDAKGIQILGNWRSAGTMYYADNALYALEYDELEKFVDDKTKAKTYSDNAGTAVTNWAVADAFVNVGKATGTAAGSNKNYAKMSITGTAVEATIAFSADSGDDAKGTSWSAY